MGNPIVGALLFGFGLFVIINFNYNLYTGKIGYLGQNKTLTINLPIILFGNCCSAAFAGFVLSLTRLQNLVPIAKEICQTKLNDSIFSHLILSICCGILMFIAVDGARTINNNFAKTLIVFLAISIFILSGFEHCIANVFYFSFCSDVNWEAAKKILIAIIGNSIGSLLISIPKRKFLD